ncbi:hypothetical protein AtDm6_2336 [Acetobacter tropicalis]|uniref:Uncharacterized protein n=1 Tax=Acetobacter tropicalis TaxID=104102 RepID=A0A094YJX9_9PROT|nr:hypothetical protein AtDm6_2336 [Acetobacter tropicalis]
MDGSSRSRALDICVRFGLTFGVLGSMCLKQDLTGLQSGDAG